MGCAAPALRSMMASRRWPSATPPSASTHTLPASGPRCRTLSIMASPTERNASAEVSARQSINPAIPHIALIPNRQSFGIAPARHLRCRHGAIDGHQHLGCGQLVEAAAKALEVAFAAELLARQTG